MGTTKYSHLLGKSKKDILSEMGNQYNHYPSNIWTYQLSKNWFGRKKIMVIYFSDDSVEDIVVHWSW